MGNDGDFFFQGIPILMEWNHNSLFNIRIFPSQTDALEFFLEDVQVVEELNVSVTFVSLWLENMILRFFFLLLVWFCLRVKIIQ